MQHACLLQERREERRRKKREWRTGKQELSREAAHSATTSEQAFLAFTHQHTPSMKTIFFPHPDLPCNLIYRRRLCLTLFPGGGTQPLLPERLPSLSKRQNCTPLLTPAFPLPSMLFRDFLHPCDWDRGICAGICMHLPPLRAALAFVCGIPAHPSSPRGSLSCLLLYLLHVCTHDSSLLPACLFACHLPWRTGRDSWETEDLQTDIPSLAMHCMACLLPAPLSHTFPPLPLPAHCRKSYLLA